MPAAAEPAPPLPPPSLDLRTGGKILRWAAAHLLRPASLPLLLLAALLLVLFRSALVAGTLRLASFADKDPALRSLLSRLSPPSPPPPTHHLPSRRSPFTSSSPSLSDDDFLVGTLDPASSAPSRRRNASYYEFLFTPSSSPKHYPVPLPHRLPSTASAFFFVVHNETSPPKPTSPRGGELRLLDLTRRDAAAIINLLALLSSVHVLAIFGYIASHSTALGVVFASVAGRHLQGHQRRRFHFSGIALGAKRLTGFAFLRWATRDAIVQMLCLWFFSEVHDQAQLFRLFVVTKLMPFSASVNPWLAAAIAGSDLDGFFIAWALLDAIVSVLFTVVPWVVVMDHDPRLHGRNAVKEGCYLVSLMATDATLIKCWETVVCGSMGRLAMVAFGGKVLGEFLHSIAEVYFMVVWLMFYFSARCKEVRLGGRHFGLEDVAAALDGFRQ
ncbi:hypothetical protein ABZP36_028373 [Zizania latifolia]